jgi:hypothetical protein
MSGLPGLLRFRLNTKRKEEADAGVDAIQV